MHYLQATCVSHFQHPRLNQETKQQASREEKDTSFFNEN